MKPLTACFDSHIPSTDIREYYALPSTDDQRTDTTSESRPSSSWQQGQVLGISEDEHIVCLYFETRLIALPQLWQNSPVPCSSTGICHC